jgi:putative transposase
VLGVSEWRKTEAGEQPADAVLRSHTGVALTRPVAFKFALDPTLAQHQVLMAHAGAARFAFNHHLARVKANLDQRRAEASYGIEADQQTPRLSWSKVSFINAFNAWKTGRLPSSPVWVDTDGVEQRGLAWRDQVAQDVFECASVNAAQALANFSNSVSGVRAGKKAGFPHCKCRHKSTPSFKIRSKSKPGQTAPVRVTGPKSLRLGPLGEMRVHGSTKRVRRMLRAGRFHVHGASFRFEKGRWWVSLQGVAAPFHHERRSPAGRHQLPAGLDVGVKALAVVADTSGVVLHQVEGVRALQHAQARLRRANQALARTKPGSVGRRKAKQRLVKIHARVGHLRTNQAHLLSKQLTIGLTRLTVEDLNVAGMVANRSLAKAISYAGIGDLGRLLAYKAAWYGLELVEADRWYPSSKSCSGCGRINPQLALADRTHRCPVELGGCGLLLDRDVNAAVNLARWPGPQTAPHAPPHAA